VKLLVGKRSAPVGAARHTGRTMQHGMAHMNFRISALELARFAPLFGQSDAALAAQGARRVVATHSPGFPCRVSLADAEPGETLLLLHYEHLAADTPYRASHAIYVREAAAQAEPAAGEVPEVLRRRLLSVRAFDAADMMVDADVVDGVALAPVIARMFSCDNVSYLHLHNAKPGCYAARVDRHS
jgi:hypothetical protein